MLKTAIFMTMAALAMAGAPQEARDGRGVEVRTGNPKVMHRTGVAYPAEAQAKGISGDVVAAVTVNDKGEVADATIVSGPEELRSAVLKSVLRWHFEMDPSQPKTIEVAVRFTPVAPEPTRGAVAPANDFTVDRIDLMGLPAALQSKVEAALAVRVGEVVARDRWPEIDRALKAVDPHLYLKGSFLGNKSDMHAWLSVAIDSGADTVISGVSPIRIGGNEQAVKLVQKVTPKYPAEAKAARVQGQVNMTATIGKDGAIRNLELLSGPTELVQSAMDAVKQWVYRPTLLNGDPVEVITTITVNYTLAP